MPPVAPWLSDGALRASCPLQQERGRTGDVPTRGPRPPHPPPCANTSPEKGPRLTLRTPEPAKTWLFPREGFFLFLSFAFLNHSKMFQKSPKKLKELFENPEIKCFYLIFKK